LGRRRSGMAHRSKPKVTSSEDVFRVFLPMMSDLQYEEFWILLLNRSNLVINTIKISQGGISGTVTDVRIILKHAIEKKASSIILCHNHPSGNHQPSESDIQITDKLKKAGELMEVNVLDHIIITDHSYFSFADEGML
ncbi:MAG: JAB domain-containing protein, partial [Bacteroidota bacterium]